MEDLSGLTIKGYKLQERIGAGGFGAVYRAYQSTVGREVAVKIILPGFTNHPDFIRRFETEAQLVARLEHLHIAPLHDYWRDPEGAYLVMRYLRGGSLRDSLRQGAYDLETASVLLDQVAAALSHAHRNKVIHRDIKPENILLDEDGNAYVADFGIAKDVGLDGDERTAAGSFVGSPDYLAPEQARSEAVTARTDIYSLGVVLYEMVVGQHPFPGLTPVERLFKHVNDPLPETTELDGDVRTEVNRIIQKATAKDPKHRYSDVRRLADDFREAAGLGVSRVARSVVELFTPREQEVLKLMVEGKSNPEIAEALTIELTTVKWYVNQIYRKLKVRSRVQAIVRAREMDLIVETDDFSDLSTSFLKEPENPYKGLESFRSSDEHHFFGREKLTKQLLSRMAEDAEHSRFLAVVGPSGSGKSSLIKAGLIPAIWRGGIPGSERWFIIDMLPGERPLDELEIALQRIAGPQSGNLMEHLRRDEHGLVRATNLVLPDDDSELLLLIDQFEELFIQVESEDERAHFLGLLQNAVDSPRSRVRVVLTLRADFYDRPLQYPGFGELVQERTLTVLPLSAEELERAILHPAEGVGVQFEDGLVASIIEDVHYQPGGLPLMQYALTELFNGREDHTLTHEAYHRIGRAVGALANRVDGIYAELDETGQQAVRQVFLRLVTLGEGAEDTRRRVPRSELLAIREDPFLVDELIDTYAASRLLSLDNDPETRSPTVELAHEAILREWERLGRWLDESRADIRLQQSLGAAAGEWRKSGEDNSYLLRGMRLAQYEQWADETDLALTAKERDFLLASLDQRDKDEAEETARRARELDLERRRRRLSRALTAALAIGLIVAVGLSGFAFRQRQDALRQASVGLAAQALAELDGPSPERAVLLALEALEQYPYSPQAENALAQAVLRRPQPFSIGEFTAAFHVAAEYSPDGTLLVASSEQFIRVWDIGGAENVLSAEIFANDYTCIPITLSWSPSGTRFAAAIGSLEFDEQETLRCSDPRLEIWGADLDLPSPVIAFPEAEARSVDWSPDGKGILVGMANGDLLVLNPTSGETMLDISVHQDMVTDVSWSPTGQRFLTVSWDGTAGVWDGRTGDSILRTHSLPTRLTSGDWSPDGSVFVITGEDGSAGIWSADTGERLVPLTGHDGRINRVIWAPSGDQIASASADGTVRLWDSTTGREIQRLHNRSVRSIAISSDGSELVMTGSGIIQGWKVPQRSIFHLDDRSGTPAAFWSPDGRMIATNNFDLSAQVWDFESGTTSLSLIPSAGMFVDWSPDGRKIVTMGSFSIGTHIWDADTGTVILSIPQTQDDQYHSGTWSPDGSRIASGRWTYLGLDIWDSETGEVIATSGKLECFPYYPTWSPEGTAVASGCRFTAEEGDDTPLFIWDPTTGSLVKVIESDAGETTMGMWSPDGEHIAVAYEAGVVKILDAASWSVVAAFAAHTGAVEFVTWSPNGQRIASADEAGNVKIWDAFQATEVMSISEGSAPTTLDWSPDGRWLVVSSFLGTPYVTRVWESTRQLIQEARECCVVRQLTADERAQFGLPPAKSNIVEDP